jgi:hypothetical protein
MQRVGNFFGAIPVLQFFNYCCSSSLKISRAVILSRTKLKKICLHDKLKSESIRGCRYVSVIDERILKDVKMG